MSWALVILTLALLIVTYMYMRHTKRLANDTTRMADDTKRTADIMARDYEDKVAPLIDVKVRPASHFGRGFKIPCFISNLGEYPITANKVVMEWWYRKEPSQRRRVEKALDDRLLRRGEEPIPVDMHLADDVIKNEKIPETLERQGHKLGKLVAASIWLEFLDKNNTPRETPERTLNPLA